jgi:hypothetical protein
MGRGASGVQFCEKGVTLTLETARERCALGKLIAGVLGRKVRLSVRPQRAMGGPPKTHTREYFRVDRWSTMNAGDVIRTLPCVR